MKLLAKNRRATYDYQIEDKLVAGLVLSGAEVKSAKRGNVSFKGSFVQIRDNEAWLHNAHITPYNMAGNRSGLDPIRNRKLLLHRKQLTELAAKKQNGYQLVALALLEDRNLVKLEIGIGRSKRKYDKRETIKRRTQEREANRQIKA
ncbi:MAG TPA: SsrA-binding protein SmpB [Candidatus Polarisedimenticolaceae bacterium]|nr:SsrA-binding protein SmpB [Candidatus Polarisedimenticolaceae bacterium]